MFCFPPNQRQPQPKLPSAIACIPTHPDGRAPPRQAVPTRKGVDVPREPESRQAKQVSSHTSQIRGDEPAKGHGESELFVDQQGDKEMMEERQEISVGSGGKSGLPFFPYSKFVKNNYKYLPLFLFKST